MSICRNALFVRVLASKLSSATVAFKKPPIELKWLLHLLRNRRQQRARVIPSTSTHHIKLHLLKDLRWESKANACLPVCIPIPFHKWTFTFSSPLSHLRKKEKRVFNKVLVPVGAEGVGAGDGLSEGAGRSETASLVRESTFPWFRDNSFLGNLVFLFLSLLKNV